MTSLLVTYVIGGILWICVLARICRSVRNIHDERTKAVCTAVALAVIWPLAVPVFVAAWAGFYLQDRRQARLTQSLMNPRRQS